MAPDEFLSALAAGNVLLERAFDAKFGRIEGGYAADIVIACYPSPTPIYPANLAGHLIFGMTSSVVETVIIGGRIVMKNRTFDLDTETIYEEAHEQAERLWRRINAIEARSSHFAL